MENKYAVNNFMTGNVVLVDTEEQASNLFWQNVISFIKIRYGNVMYYQLQKSGDDYISNPVQLDSLPTLNLSMEEINALVNTGEIPTAFKTSIAIDNSLPTEN